jgi:hypothetical protein
MLNNFLPIDSIYFLNSGLINSLKNGRRAQGLIIKKHTFPKRLSMEERNESIYANGTD